MASTPSTPRSTRALTSVQSPTSLQTELTPPPTPLHQLIKSGVMVKVSVGTEKETWLLHEGVICERSEWFNKAFMGGYMESDQKQIYLQDEEPEMFGHFVDWLYGKGLFCYKDHAKPSDITFSHVREWLALYIFADKIALKALAQEALEQYNLCAEGTLPCTKEILLVYRNTMSGSPLRQSVVKTLMAEFFDQGEDDFDFISDAIGCHPEFTRDISSALKSHTRLSTKKRELASCSAHNKTPRVAGHKRKR
ncbi:hypothetical protein L207DRAFT_584162 [Hyaloscypha variabilis F]|uniref:BTB domain-containing protein n=1 Tax=Hyaloscypha variabilis (strain UAMH 11265 / GT02V1 / F) TaxID=1149755 RepID=A0A2J6RJT5_HYAVF|nr:hypothetical protein L207DRAFT_584162 [Hyaloscypha variabilis F]